MLVYLIRALLLFTLVFLAIRLMGKRQIGEMEPSEFVVSLLMADLAAVPMQDLGIPLLSGVIPILTIMAVELVMSVLSYRFIFLRKILCGNPVLVMQHGKIIHENLKKTRLTPDELIEQLREKDIFDLSTIQYAILETNGQISAMIDSRYLPPSAIDQKVQATQQDLPITLVSSGKLVKDALTTSNRSKEWVLSQLEKRKCKLNDVILFMTDSTGNTYLATKEDHS